MIDFALPRWEKSGVDSCGMVCRPVLDHGHRHDRVGQAERARRVRLGYRPPTTHPGNGRHRVIGGSLLEPRRPACARTPASISMGAGSSVLLFISSALKAGCCRLRRRGAAGEVVSRTMESVTTGCWCKATRVRMGSEVTLQSNAYTSCLTVSLLHQFSHQGATNLLVLEASLYHPVNDATGGDDHGWCPQYVEVFQRVPGHGDQVGP